MEYMTPLQKKRRHEGDLQPWRDCQAKRLCNRVGVCVQVEHGGMVTDSAMDTWDASMQQQSVPNSNSGVGINHPASNMVYAVHAVQGSQRCNRCLAGEPGHINHIMGYWLVIVMIRDCLKNWRVLEDEEIWLIDWLIAWSSHCVCGCERFISVPCLFLLLTTNTVLLHGEPHMFTLPNTGMGKMATNQTVDIIISYRLTNILFEWKDNHYSVVYIQP